MSATLLAQQLRALERAQVIDESLIGRTVPGHLPLTLPAGKLPLRFRGLLSLLRAVDSTMARAVPGWNPRSSEGAVTGTGQSLIDPGLLERASRR